MPEQPTETLQRALDEMDRLRRRSLTITRILLAMSIAFLCVACLLILFSQNKWLGMYFALCTLYTLISAVGINLGGLPYTNTQRILKAINTLHRRQPE